MHLLIWGCAWSSLPCVDFTLVAVSGGYSLVVHRRLTEVASLVVKYGL